MASDPKFLDLDALTTAEQIFKHKGVEYPMVPITVEGWLENLKQIENLTKFSSDPANSPADITKKNMEVAIATLARAYPSFPTDEFQKMPMAHLDQITRFTQAYDGTDAAKLEAAREAAANPTEPSAPETTA